MSLAAINRVRIEVGNTRPVGSGQNDVSSIIDKITNQRVRLPFASAVRIEVAIYDHDILASPLTGLTALALEFRDATNGIIDISGAAVLGPVPLGISDFNPALTEDQWEGDTGTETPWHAAFTLTEANMTTAGLCDTPTNNEQTMGIVICGTGASGRFVLGSGLVTIVKTGATGAGSAVLPTVSYTLTDQQIYAMLAQAGQFPAGLGPVLTAADGIGKVMIVYESDLNGGYRVDFTPL